MGDPGESVVRAHIGGEAHEGSLTDGVLSLDVPAHAGRSMRIELESDVALLTRLEASYARAPEPREGPLTLGLRGDSGSLDARALFELSIEASRAIGQPVVEFSLPAGAELDDSLRQDLVSNGAVASVQLREGGIVRLGLRPIAAGQRVTIPLPLRFVATGTQRGLALLAFPSDEPRALSVLPARTIEVTDTDDGN